MGLVHCGICAIGLSKGTKPQQNETRRTHVCIIPGMYCTRIVMVDSGVDSKDRVLEKYDSSSPIMAQKQVKHKVQVKCIKNNAWIIVSNIFLVASEVICQWFIMSENHWQIPSRVTKKTLFTVTNV